MKKLSWKPKRRGPIYCAPACGRGCTKTMYDQAVKHAKQTLRRMKTRGWEVRVWENLGWHYMLTNKLCGLSLHLNYNKTGYWCMMAGHDAKNVTCGDAYFDVTQSFKDPNQAVEAMFKIAVPVMEAEVRGLANLRSIK